MCLSLCVPWLTPPCLARCMSSSRATASCFAAAWTRARGSLGCVLMIPRKGKCICMNHNTERPSNQTYGMGKCVYTNKLNCAPLQVCRPWLHADHQECPFPAWWTVSSGHHRRETLPGPDTRDDGWLQYCEHRESGRYQGKNHENSFLRIICSVCKILVFKNQFYICIYQGLFWVGFSL